MNAFIFSGFEASELNGITYLLGVYQIFMLAFYNQNYKFSYFSQQLTSNQVVNMPPRAQWIKQEEDYLKELKQKRQMQSWAQIATMISQKFPEKQYTGKQCRQRYINHVQYALKPSEQEWYPKDHLELLKYVGQEGTKWRDIAQKMPGRSQNSIKNKFYGIIRRMIRHINCVGKKHIKKFSKPIKHEAVMRILETAEVMWHFYPSIKQRSQNLKKQILEIACEINLEEIPEEISLGLIRHIHDFNLATRSYNLKKTKKILNRLEITQNTSQQQFSSSLRDDIDYENKPTLQDQSGNQGSPLSKQMIDETPIIKLNSHGAIRAQIENFLQDIQSEIFSASVLNDQFFSGENDQDLNHLHRKRSINISAQRR